MKRFQKVGLVLLALVVVLPIAAKKVIPVVKGTHFLSFDLDKKDFIPFDNDKPMQVFVVGPDGIEPGVYVAESTDGTRLLLATPEVAAELLTPNIPADAPQVPKESPKSN